jgi:hypothetical protein
MNTSGAIDSGSTKIGGGGSRRRREREGGSGAAAKAFS